MAVKPLDNPLTDRDKQQLDQALYLLNQMLPKLDQAERAGRDVTALRMRRDDLANQAAQIKAAYFPGSK